MSIATDSRTVNPLKIPSTANLLAQTSNGSLVGREVRFFNYGQYDHERIENNSNRSWQNIAAHVGVYIAEGLALGTITLIYGLLNGVALLEPTLLGVTIPVTLITAPVAYRLYIAQFDMLHAHIDRYTK
jgi:hypothetical protein